MNIQNYFARHIYNRGVDIYNSGGVYNVVKVGNVYKGKVLGNHEYDVEIEVSDQLKITDMRCTCLYAMKGKKCKHEAALLIELFGNHSSYDYDYDDYDDDHDYEDYDDDYDDYGYDYDTKDDNCSDMYQGHEILEPLSKKSKEELLEIIGQTLESSETYQTFFHIIEDMQRVNHIYQMIYQYISSNQIPISEDYEKIYTSIQNLHHFYQDQYILDLAKEALNQLLHTFPSLQSYQEDFFHQMIQLIDTYASQNEKTSIYFDLCVKYNQSVIYQLIDKLHQQNIPLDDLLSSYQQKISSYPISTEIYDKYLYILYHYQRESLSSVIDTNKNNLVFIKEAINLYMNHQDYQKAIDLCLQQLQEHPHQDIYLLLLDIYKQTNQNEQIIALATDLLYHQYPGQIQYYQLLQQSYLPEIWEHKKKDIIHDLEKNQINISEIYIQEKMYDALFQYLAKNDDIFGMKKHEDILFEHCLDNMIQYYSRYVMNSLRHTGSRSFYHEMAELIHKISEYDFDKAFDLSNHLISLYPNRPAMIEEIRIFKVKLKDVIRAIEMTDQDITWYYQISHGQFINIDDDTNIAKKMIVLNSPDYIQLPDHYDIHEYHIMEMFANQLKDQHMKRELQKTLKGKGAFRRFKDFIYKNQLNTAWQQFLYETHRELAIQWCHKHNIEFVE